MKMQKAAPAASQLPNEPKLAAPDEPNAATPNETKSQSPAPGPRPLAPEPDPCFRVADRYNHS
jgi:hypothetical protein